jgi:hypothetical protein
MSLSRIILRLARNPGSGRPEGDPSRGYTIVAPLDAQGRLDVDAWRKDKRRCTVIRFSPDAEEAADGFLTHRGSHWHFHYDEEGEGPDEPLFRLGDHKLALGEYVAIKELDGDELVYRVAEVQPVKD